MLQLGPTFFFAAKQTNNKEKKKFNQQRIMVPDEFYN